MTARAVACGIRWAAAAVCAAGVSAAARPVGAQSSFGEFRIEGGAASIRQTEARDRRAAGLLSALWRAADERFAVLASGAFTYAGDSVTAVQGIGALAWRPSTVSAWRTEGGIAGAGFGVYSLGRGGNFSSYVRQRFELRRGSVWLGGSAGRTLRDDISSHATGVDAGASVRSGAFEGRASFARVRSSDRKLFEAAGILLPGDATTYDLDDVVVALHYARARVTLDLSNSWRDGRRATQAGQFALYGSAEYGFTPRVSMALSAGRLLADAVRGVPDVQVVAATIRLVLLPWHDADDGEASTLAMASVTPNPAGATLVVVVNASAEHRVEVAGSFSGWEPVPLVRTAGGWEASVALGSGAHRVAVRVDGGAWRAPANLGKVKDGFGGTSGIIVVP